MRLFWNYFVGLKNTFKVEIQLFINNKKAPNNCNYFNQTALPVARESRKSQFPCNSCLTERALPISTPIMIS